MVVTGNTTQRSPLRLVSPLSARLVVWWFICTTGLRANHLNWLRLFRHCVRHFAFRRRSAQMSINHESRQKKERRGEERQEDRKRRTSWLQGLKSFRSHEHKIKLPSYTSREIECEVFVIWAAHRTRDLNCNRHASASDSLPLASTAQSGDFVSKLQQLTCCVWGCGCTEKRELWGAGTEACQVNRTPSGRPPAGCASCPRFPLRTLQTRREGEKKPQILSSCWECNSGVIVVIQNTILTSPLQNKLSPHKMCVITVYWHFTWRRQEFVM